MSGTGDRRGDGPPAEVVARIPAVIFQLRRGRGERERFPFAGEGITDLVGLPAAALAEDSAALWSLLDRETAARVVESLAQSEAELAPWEAEFQVRLPSGELRWLAALARPTREPGGATVWYGLLFNATEQRRLRQSDKMAAVARLAGGVAHELNNLLTAIGSYGDMAIGELPADHPARRYLERSGEASARAAELTRELLAFGRQQVLQLEGTRWNDVVREADTAGRLVPPGRREVTLDLRLDPAAPTVYADRGQLDRVVTNLVANAVEAMPSGGRLTIATGGRTIDEAEARAHAGMQPGRYAWLSVHDDGVGVDETVRAHIFEPFFSTKAPRGAPTGLGLSTVYGIVKQLDGYVKLESDAAAGTTFTVYLPEAGAPRAVLAPADVAPAAAAGMDTPVRPRPPSPGTVLVAEDESSVREPVRRVLERHGYRVFDAADGGAALAIAESGQAIDLLLTDLVMPGMSGSELARQICALQPSVRVVFMSGYSSEAVAMNGMLAPGAAFLQKPFSVTELVERVRTTLGAAPS